MYGVNLHVVDYYGKCTVGIHVCCMGTTVFLEVKLPKFTRDLENLRMIPCFLSTRIGECLVLLYLLSGQVTQSQGNRRP